MGPFFFLALALAAVGSRLGVVTIWALSVLAMVAAGWAGRRRGGASSVLLFLVVSYAALVSINTLVVSPAYTPAGLYQPLLMLAGFFVARRLPHGAQRNAGWSALLMVAVLATWGLYEVGPLGAGRAHAIFETPATFAAVINLTLVPLLAATLVGVRHRVLLAAALPLSAALFAADSRGGLLALAAGIAFASVLAMRNRLLRGRGVAVVVILLALGWILAGALRALPVPQSEAAPSAQARAESSLSRLELYALSWSAWREKPVVGTGYLTFRYTLEQGRAQVPSYGSSGETWFVHDDYLQTLQELGPIGLLAFLGLTVFPPLLAHRRIPELSTEQRPSAVALAAGTTAMSIHALVDFPFYVPICLLLYGALLGALDLRLSVASSKPILKRESTPWHRVARAAGLTLVGIVFARPIAAEAAAQWGLRNAAAGHGEVAAFWLGAAQRVEPRDWRYHWYAGQFWDAQAALSGKPEAARLAAEAYAAGFKENRLEVKNLLGKIAVQERHRHLLDKPADESTMRLWRSQALVLAPLNPDVRKEVAR